MGNSLHVKSSYFAKDFCLTLNNNIYEKKDATTVANGVFLDPARARRREVALRVLAAHPVFTARYLDTNYGIHFRAFAALRRGDIISDCYYRRLVKAIIDDTPDDSVASFALLRALADTQWEE